MHATFLILAAALAWPAAARAQADPQRAEALVIELTNALRRAEGRSAVRPEPRLEESARRFARFMAESGRYGHEADGSTPAARAERDGYAYCSVSENISYQYSSAGFTTRELAQRLVEGWKASPGHRRNMLAPHVVHTGVAVARAKNGYYYAVQLFGRPRAARIAFHVENRAGATVRYRLGDERFALPAGAVHTHTRCVPEALAVESGGGKPRGRALTPRDGDRLAVVREGGSVSIRR